MAKKPPLLSEGEELKSFLAGLERENEIKEIAGLESGFSALSRALNGIFPGLYLLIGRPSCGKSAFAKQMCDQVAQRNAVPAIFYTFGETKKELRIRTLARLSGLENREIRRGSSFLLHWYGVPKRRGTDPERMAPSWEKLKGAAEEAKSWLDLLYLFEGNERPNLRKIEEQVQRVKEIKRSEQVMVVIDDGQRLGSSDRPFDERLPLVTEMLQGLAVNLQVPILATWPDLEREGSGSEPQAWAERVAGADVIMVLEDDAERTKKSTEPTRAINLHIVKNRGGERGKLYFDFFPSLAKFTQASPDHEAEG
jgi:replicative DNA helicase